MSVENEERGPGPATSPSARRRSADGRRHTAAREQVLRTLEAQTAPVSVRALSRATGLHENTVRGHLDQLLADGHATRATAPAEGRGRPAWLWRPTRHGAASPYAALAAVLAGTIARTSADPAATAREAGLAWGRQVLGDLPTGSTEPTARDRVLHVMEDQGFAPADDGETISLHRCPLLEAADQHPQVVCAVHRGLVDALLAPPGTREPAARADLVPFAAPGVCRLHLREEQ